MGEATDAGGCHKVATKSSHCSLCQVSLHGGETSKQIGAGRGEPFFVRKTNLRVWVSRKVKNKQHFQQLEAESEIYKDIVQGDFEDTYKY